MARCREKYCPDCKGVCKDDAVKSGIETLATALLEERAKGNGINGVFGC